MIDIVRGMLLERDAELGILGAIVDGLDSTGGKVVLVRGEAGIGKTALVNSFAELRAPDCSVRSGACDDLFSPQPLGPFWDIARVEPSLRGPIDVGDRPHLLEAVLDLLSRPARPTIFIIEDTHWADEATLDAIRFLGRRIARTNGVLVLTYRDGEVDDDHPLRGVIGDIPAHNLARIQLSGLSLAAVSTMVGGSGLEPTDIFATTRGNPFLVSEMASSGTGTPASLNDSVMARVRKLSIGAQEMIKTLAVIPEPIPRADALRLVAADELRLDECVQRGLLDPGPAMVEFRHELIRRTVDATMTPGERLAKNRAVLEALSEDTHASLLIHCAVAANDVDRLVRLAPISARYAASVGGHIQAARDFRELAPHLGRIGPAELGPLLDAWAAEEFLVDAVAEAIRLNELARDHYRALGDRRAESRALARGAHFMENAGQRKRAEKFARAAIEVLGPDPDGADLARALEVSAYLQMMAGNVAAVPELVDQTLEAGGPDIDTTILIRSLNHRGIVANIADYPEGRANLDDARQRAEAKGEWYEECRALLNHAWAAVEARDLRIGADYAQRAIASAVRYQLPGLEVYSKAIYARALELRGDWTEATDIARELLDASAITQMVALPIVGVIEARKGRPSARVALTQAWQLAGVADEFQRLAPAATALAEYLWISGDADVAVTDLERVMVAGLDLGFRWSPGAIAFWLWELGELAMVPKGIAEPYRLVIEGHATEAAAIWAAKGLPYERALAQGHGSHAEKFEGIEAFETLGATAVGAKLRQTLRHQGVAVPRGKGLATRRHAAGLTARQAEILLLLDEGLTNTEIADRRFLSPRTVENHVAAVLDKLDVATREGAVSRTRADGLLGATRQI